MGRVLRPSDAVAVVGTVDPDALTATTHDTDWVDLRDFEKLMAIITWGSLGENATIDAKLREATDSSGTSAQDITSKAITQIDNALTPQSEDQQAIINLSGDEMDVADGFTHVSLRITVATATSDGAGLLLGFNPRYGPASDRDLSSVVEIIA